VARDVVDRDRGYRKFARNMQRFAKGPNVTVGVQGTQAAETRKFGETNAAIAAIHEFGSIDGRIPQRSFIRAPMDRERALINRMLEVAVRSTARDGNARKHLGIVGARARAEMVRTIDQSIGLAPLAAATVARKRSSRPLIDTGQLKASLTWKVHDG